MIDFSENKFFSKKNIITLLVIGIGLLIIPFSVKLVEQTNILQTRATGDEITFVPGGNVSCDSSGVCKASGTKFQVLLKSPLGPPGTPAPTQPPTVTPGQASIAPTIAASANLLNANMQNRVLSGAKSYAINDPWFGLGTYSLSGSVAGNGEIRADEYNVNAEGKPADPPGTQATHANNSTFTVPLGRIFNVVLQVKADGGTATFSGVSLTKTDQTGN